LVVDDDRDTVESTVTLLRLHGFRVAGATCWEQAAVAAVTQPPDVALIDLAMPGVDGCEFAHRLRGVAARPPLLVAVTGLSTDRSQQRASAAGFALYLVKPVAPAGLVTLLRQCEQARGDETPNPTAC
jgi:CheY-like chemotaxis protein